MKFTVISGALLQALLITGRCIPTRSIAPIHECFLFKISGGRLEITATNSEVYLTTSIEIDGAIETSLAIGASLLSNLIKSLPDQPIAFEIEPTSVNIMALTGSYTLPTEDADAFPTFKDKEVASFEISATALTSGLEKTLFAAGKDDLRPAMKGVNFSFANDKIYFTATNTHMLSTFGYYLKVDNAPSFILPSKTLSILSESPMSENILVTIGERGVSFKVNEETTLRSLMVDERYVDFMAVLPTNNDKILTLNRAGCLGALKRVIQFANATTKSVKLSISEKSCTLSAEDTDYARKGKEQLEHSYTSEAIDIGLHGGQLLDCLSKFDTKEVFIYVSTANRPILIRDRIVDIKSKEDLMLTMPIMLLQ